MSISSYVSGAGMLISSECLIFHFMFQVGPSDVGPARQIEYQAVLTRWMSPMEWTWPIVTMRDLTHHTYRVSLSARSQNREVIIQYYFIIWPAIVAVISVIILHGKCHPWIVPYRQLRNLSYNHYASRSFLIHEFMRYPYLWPFWTWFWGLFFSLEMSN